MPCLAVSAVPLRMTDVTPCFRNNVPLPEKSEKIFCDDK